MFEGRKEEVGFFLPSHKPIGYLDYPAAILRECTKLTLIHLLRGEAGRVG